MDETNLRDPEEAALAELEAAEEEKESGEPQAESADAAPPEPEPEPAAAPEPASAPAPDEIRIPKPRLDAVLQRARELELENARLSGIIEAGQRPPEPAAPRGNPAADRLIAIENAKDALWARYDKGEVAFSEMKKAERALDGESQQIRAALTMRQAAPQSASIDGDLRLGELTSELAQRNLWVGYIPTDYMVETVMPMAEKILARRGLPLSKDAAGAYRLRQASVDVARAMGAYRLFAPRELWPDESDAVTPPAARRPNAALSPAQVKEKLSLARRHPPDASGLSARLSSELVGSKDIESMSEEELAQLSESDLERLAPSRTR